MRDLSSRGKTAVLLVALLALLGTKGVQAYSVRYAGKVSLNGMMNFETVGYCGQDDSGHSMMPKLQSYQTSAAEVLSNNNFNTAPIGGESRQSACLDANCTWQFNHGLHYRNEITFYYGVVYKENLLGGPADGIYNNFASGQPVWWSNVSYWGGRQPYMMSGGQWANGNVVTYFTQWVCEYYEYQLSDASIFPTYPDGQVITPHFTGNYYHCDKVVERDSQGRWIYQRCKEPFPWWGGLVIAIVSLMVVVVIIITICCLSFGSERRKIRKERERKLETLADNPAQVPNQTQVGLGRTPAHCGDD
ncbi:conserved hypothetical protein [Leishmania braziliensis MHOM/BR/75/M2904]|uniref:Uncharacterized protein n=2 Tax=Leishmania braziliensis TaxID=5660 RepID=E9AI94_LEIBR|nr:conserved hypothetical protein [Leishmania braziliensis MHOM/BR/75/M2904]KAI5686714.1 hypothetical protein MNV84_03362 [Leishmania braziliensis]CAJ2471893.1 unnamed protein product [Leishmania braziliensis]CAJ2472408.1 unnamed protein product [Leishmania braziliensis]CBZ14537.1 conserved hypothetical protein [Leishmania braziliensis MHOM/BR/75/M2904]SYZ65484.1 Protein_of_uncharacterised_function_(DUF2946) [Leishmania braziliensis MHOM/BR/75/M2904]